MPSFLRLSTIVLMLTGLLGLLLLELAGRGPFGDLWVPYLLLIGYGAMECLWSHAAPPLASTAARHGPNTGGSPVPIPSPGIPCEPLPPLIAPGAWKPAAIRIRRARAVVATAAR